MANGRYSGDLVGIPETTLYDLEEDALRLFETGKLCEPIGQLESVAMANSLTNSAPCQVTCSLSPEHSLETGASTN